MGWKKSKWGGGGGSMGTYFFRKKPWKFFFYPWKFQTEQSFPKEFPQNCVAPLLEIPCHGQKPTPMGVQHNFFLITPANFFSFVIKPQNFHLLFPQYPWKSHVLNSPCLFFWNSPIRHMRVIPCQIIQGMTPLPLRFCSFFHYL